MKRIFFWIRGLACIAASMFSLSSCLVTEPVPGLVSETADISFIARMPATAVVNTRAGETETGTEAENKIDNIYVLSFNTAGELTYKGKAKDLKVVEDNPEVINNNKVTFKATLPVSVKCDLMLLANAEGLLTNINVDGSVPVKKTEVEALVLEAAAKWEIATTPIPMWDELKDLELKSASKPAFFLTRMLARINVEYTSTEEVFRLTGVRYYNYNTVGTLIPANIAAEEGKRYVTATTLPDDPKTQTGKFMEYDVEEHKKCEHQIYVFEAENPGTYEENNWINNPCLVISGKYDSNRNGFEDEINETWYRIDFVKKVGSKEEWLDLLRNFSYNVVIKSVSGDGYRNPDEALKSIPMNIDAGIVDWNDGEMSDIIVDGANFLSAGRSRNEGLQKAASLYRNATSTDEIEFNTNIDLDKFDMELTDGGKKIDDKDFTEEDKKAGVIAKFANDYYEVKIVQGKSENGINYGKFVFVALKNYSASNPNPSVLTVTSGRIRYTVDIYQRDASPNDWVNGGSKEESLGKK